ncbi:major facilitator superfamily domain-containing protein [Tricladium varicosporioides]|nr:major facilitator superfamily domain-containing protein [Hymenoscyphus varicosporioides]
MNSSCAIPDLERDNNYLATQEKSEEVATQHPRSTKPQEKQLASQLGHDADIPTNRVSIDEQGELKKPHSISSRHSSRTAQEIPTQDDTKGDIEKRLTDISAEENEDANIVWWEDPDDPQNPLNFGTWMKALNISLVSAICFVTPLASSMFTPGVPQLMEEFGSKNVLLAGFVVSVYVLGFAIGPLALAPASEIYGRLPIYHVCNLGFVAFTIACALATNLNMLIGFRFMAGLFGSAPLVNGGGTIADLVVQEKRGAAMSGFVMGPIVGPIIGPIAGGFLSGSKGWRWVFWVIAIISGTFTILCIVFMRETYAPVILAKKTKHLRKETGNQLLRSKLDAGLSPKDFFIRSIIRPAKMLVFSPIVLITSIYVGLVYGYLYLLFTTFTIVFEGNYGFSTSSVGLSFVGIGVGSVIGVVIFGVMSDKNIRKQTEEADASAEAAGEASAGMKPEYRLPMMIPGSALIPIGLFIYGWTTHFKVHWIVPILSTALIGMGNLAVFMCTSTYLVDAFPVYAASALAANAVIRSIMGALLPLAGQKMYNTLGLGWGNSLLGFVAVVFFPVSWALCRWGEVLRKRFELRNL